MSNLQPGIDPQPGDWAVVNGHGSPVERMQLLSGGTPRSAKWVHAFGLVAPGVIVEAMPHGTVRVPLHYDPDKLWWSTGIIEKPDRNRQATIAAWDSFAEQKIPYSFVDYLAIAAHTWHIPAPGLREFIQAVGHMLCSQEVDRGEEMGGTHLFKDRRWNGYVRPLDLADLTGAP